MFHSQSNERTLVAKGSKEPRGISSPENTVMSATSSRNPCPKVNPVLTVFTGREGGRGGGGGRGSSENRRPSCGIVA